MPAAVHLPVLAAGAVWADLPPAPPAPAPPHPTPRPVQGPCPFGAAHLPPQLAQQALCHLGARCSLRALRLLRPIRPRGKIFNTCIYYTVYMCLFCSSGNFSLNVNKRKKLALKCLYYIPFCHCMDQRLYSCGTSHSYLPQGWEGCALVNKRPSTPAVIPR